MKHQRICWMTLLVFLITSGTNIFNTKDNQLTIPTFQIPAATGSFNIFNYALGKSGPYIEDLYMRLVRFDKNRDDKGKLRLTEEEKKVWSKRLIAEKDRLSAVDKYLRGSLIITELTPDNPKAFSLPFDCTVEEKLVFLTDLRNYIAPDSALATIEKGVKVILKTKNLGVIVLFIGYPPKSAATLTIIDEKTQTVAKKNVEAGTPIGKVTKGTVYMCSLFTTKIDPPLFMTEEDKETIANENNK